MSEPALSLPLNGSDAGIQVSQLWQPILARSLVTLAFGIATVFWATPGTAGLVGALAAYLLAIAVIQYWFVRRLIHDRPAPRVTRPALLVPAALTAAAAVVLVLFGDLTAAAVAGGLALLLLGAGELVLGWAVKDRPLRSDWRISGVIGLGTGVLLPFFAGLGPHAVLGVAGGGALLSGALWLLSALTLRHEVRRQARP